MRRVNASQAAMSGTARAEVLSLALAQAGVPISRPTTSRPAASSAATTGSGTLAGFQSAGLPGWITSQRKMMRV